MSRHITRYSRLAPYLLAASLLLSGCATVDQAIGSLGSALDTTNDILSGDFRTIGHATPVTLRQINTDWRQNEITAQKKYSQTLLSIPGIVTHVSKAEKATATLQKQKVFTVGFRDPGNSKCIGLAYTRDDLAVQEKTVSALKTGDRIRVVAVMDDHVGSLVTAIHCNFSFSKAKISLEPANRQAAKP